MRQEARMRKLENCPAHQPDEEITVFYAGYDKRGEVSFSVVFDPDPVTIEREAEETEDEFCDRVMNMQSVADKNPAH